MLSVTIGAFARLEELIRLSASKLILIARRLTRVPTSARRERVRALRMGSNETRLSCRSPARDLVTKAEAFWASLSLEITA